MGDLFHAKRELNYTKKLCDFIIKIKTRLKKKRRKIKYNQILQTIKKLLVQQINKILLFFSIELFDKRKFSLVVFVFICIFIFDFFNFTFYYFFFTFFFQKIIYILKCIFKYISMLIL